MGKTVGLVCGVVSRFCSSLRCLNSSALGCHTVSLSCRGRCLYREAYESIMERVTGLGDLSKLGTGRKSGARHRNSASYAVFLSLAAISCLLRRSNAISDCFNIRGAGEVPSFRLSEAVEGVTEPFLPPLFKFFAMFLPQFFKLRFIQSEFSRMRFASQGDSRQNSPTLDSIKPRRFASVPP